MKKENQGHPVRVLHVINGMGSGGAEAYIMNIYRHIDREKIQFDFLLRDGNRSNFYMQEIESLGGRIFYVPVFPKEAVRNYAETKRFFKEHPEYKVVEVHANALVYMAPLYILRKNPSVKVIMHSHNTGAAGGLAGLLHRFHRLFIHKLADECLACSDAAGVFMFKEGFKVLHNAIDTRRFANPSAPRKIGAGAVLCNVARFTPQKNHRFLIEVFDGFQKKHPDATLVLVGSGSLEAEIKEMVRKRHLDSKAVFLGEVQDVENVLAAADCFLLPSFYEGFPIALIEAQAAGLPCVVSSRVPTEVNVAGGVCFVDCFEADVWIRAAEDAVNAVNAGKADRVSRREKLIEAGYDAAENARRVTKMYL